MIDDIIDQYNITEDQINFQVFHDQLSHAIARAIKRKGWSQDEFAKKMGVDKSLVSRWLGGVHLFREETLYKIQKVLGVYIFNLNFLDDEELLTFHHQYEKKVLPSKQVSRKSTSNIRSSYKITICP